MESWRKPFTTVVLVDNLKKVEATCGDVVAVGGDRAFQFMVHRETSEGNWVMTPSQSVPERHISWRSME